MFHAKRCTWEALHEQLPLGLVQGWKRWFVGEAEEELPADACV